MCTTTIPALKTRHKQLRLRGQKGNEMVINKVRDFVWALSLARQVGGWVEERYIDDETWFFVCVRGI